MLSTQMELVRANAAAQAQAATPVPVPVPKKSKVAGTGKEKKTKTMTKSGPRKSLRGKGRKRQLESDDEDEEDVDEEGREGGEPSAKRAKVVPPGAGAEEGQRGARAGEGEVEGEEKKAAPFVQPELLSGATLKDYQLEGVAWMWSLFDQGISGILGE